MNRAADWNSEPGNPRNMQHGDKKFWFFGFCLWDIKYTSVIWTFQITKELLFKIYVFNFICPWPPSLNVASSPSGHWEHTPLHSAWWESSQNSDRCCCFGFQGLQLSKAAVKSWGSSWTRQPNKTGRITRGTDTHRFFIAHMAGHIVGHICSTVVVWNRCPSSLVLCGIHPQPAVAEGGGMTKTIRGNMSLHSTVVAWLSFKGGRVIQCWATICTV